MRTPRDMKERLQPHALPLALLCVVTLLVYLPSLGHDFLTNWDDARYVTSNATVHGITPSHIAQAFSRIYVGNYAPLQMLSYMLDYEIWGMRSSGFILTNILLHLASGLLFYRLLVMLAFSRLAAFLAAFVFLLHPVQVESVVWVSQRKNVLAMLFFLASFVAYVRYTRLESGVTGRRPAYLFSLAAFACALLAKAVVVVLPLALILYDLCYLPGETRSRRLQDKIPFILLAMLVGILTIFAQNPDISGSGGLTGYHGGGAYQTFLTMLPVMVMYLRLLFLPTRLSAVYDPAVRHGIDPAVLGAGVVVLVLLAAGFHLFRKRRDLAFWYILFFLCLGPVSQIIPLITLMNDRYLYFPLLGWAALAGYGGARLYGAGQTGAVTPANGWRPGWWGILLLFPLLSLPYLSLKRSAVWQDSVTLWTDATAKTPIADTLSSLADAHHNRREYGIAERLYRRVLLKEPLHLTALLNLSQIMMDRGDFPPARQLLEIALRAHPTSPLVFQSLGNNYYMTGDMRNAEENYRKALKINSALPQSLLPLANIMLARRDLAAAAAYLDDALRYDERNPDIYYSLACVRSLEGNGGEALKLLDTALMFGYRNTKSIMNNNELNAVREQPGFNALIGRYLN